MHKNLAMFDFYRFSMDERNIPRGSAFIESVFNHCYSLLAIDLMVT